jgi:hypothetical protein
MFESLINLIVASILALLPTSAPAPAPAPAPVAPVVAPAPVAMPPVSTIGGVEVPYGLDCEEDEVIYLLPSPHPLGVDYDAIGCVHVDSL